MSIRSSDSLGVEIQDDTTTTIRISTRIDVSNIGFGSNECLKPSYVKCEH